MAHRPQSMKFALVYNRVHDARAGASLAAMFRYLGHDAIGLNQDQCTKESLADADVVIEVDRARDDVIPKDAVHIAWVQQYYGVVEDFDGRALDHDMIYTFGTPEIIGCPQFKHWRGSLCMATDPDLLSLPIPINQPLDFSIAGYLAKPEWFNQPSKIPPNAKAGECYNAYDEVAQLARSQL